MGVGLDEELGVLVGIGREGELGGRTSGRLGGLEGGGRAGGRANSISHRRRPNLVIAFHSS